MFSNNICKHSPSVEISVKNTVFKFKHKTKTPVRETLKLDSFLIGFTEESSSKTIDRHWKHLREIINIMEY